VVETVTRVLRRRGAPPASIDDAVQTAVLRALGRDGGFDSLGGLVNWVIVVAWHEIQAEWRRSARIELGDVPEGPAGPDSAEIAEAHLALGAAIDGLSTLSDRERQAILSPILDDIADGRVEDAAAKMRRHRARRHLAAVVEQNSR
jgi:DNA-directed RNA polymerase specialized sigma24 family protein